MQFPRLPNVNSFLKKYLRDNPEQLKNYVDLGLKTVKLATAPLTGLLRHLLEVQGLDPNTEPGRRMREAFQQALDSAFSRFHDHGYDTDFDFSWLNQKFEQTRRDLKTLNLSKNDFRKMTDVGQLYSTGQTLDVAEVGTSFGDTAIRPDVRPEIPITIDKTPVQELAELLDVGQINPSVPEPAEQECDVLDDVADFEIEKFLRANGEIDPASLKEALEKISELAEDYENENVDPAQLMSRTQQLSDLKKAIKEYTEPARPIKRTGKVHRTPTGKVDAVKKSTRKNPKPRIINKTTNQPVEDDNWIPEQTFKSSRYGDSPFKRSSQKRKG